MEKVIDGNNSQFAYSANTRNAVISAGILSISCFVFFCSIIAVGSSGLYSAAYFALFTSLWIFPIALKFWGFKPNGESNEVLPIYRIAPKAIFYFVCMISSFVSVLGYLFARGYDKPAAVFAATNLYCICVLAYLHWQDRYKKSGIIYWVVAFIQFICGFIIFVLHITAAFQAVGLAIDNSSGPGSRVFLNDFGYHLHYVCGGEKKRPQDPLIWFEHGLGGSSLDFSWVQKNVSSYAKWCAIDHGGLGWSDIPSFPRTTEQIVKELQSFLVAANITDDLFVVGHSMAGYNMRVAQRLLKSNKITGIVLVDPVDTKWRNCEEGKTGNVNPLVIFYL
jgi:hypothetical protein